MGKGGGGADLLLGGERFTQMKCKRDQTATFADGRTTRGMQAYHAAITKGGEHAVQALAPEIQQVRKQRGCDLVCIRVKQGLRLASWL